MNKTKHMLFGSFLVLLLGIAPLAFAGSAVVGSVAGSINASVGGQALLPNTTIFSGDSLQVRDGAAVVAVGSQSRMVFGRDTAATFERQPNAVTILLTRGNVSLYHPQESLGLEVKAGDVSIQPAPGFKVLGDVAMLDGAVVVTAKEGTLRVARQGVTTEVVKGKTLTIPTQTRTARAPQTGGSQKLGGAGNALPAAAVAAGGTAAVLSGVAISRAGDAKDAANTAAANANSATSAANSAKSSADAATAAANAAAANANSVGCALNAWANSLGEPSPYTPPAGMSCP
ncbi:MAG TPA: hypothetical protein VFD30_18090 [Terriglobia bacterium]|jgi:hypothetical protein|nr:hypothetical protein [Terriglobia bacterium]